MSTFQTLITQAIFALETWNLVCRRLVAVIDRFHQNGVPRSSRSKMAAKNNFRRKKWWDDGSQRPYMLESSNRRHLRGKRMWMNKFITVFAYELQLCTGSHFEKSCVFSLWSMHRRNETSISGTIHHTVAKPASLNRYGFKDEQVCFRFSCKPLISSWLSFWIIRCVNLILFHVSFSNANNSGISRTRDLKFSMYEASGSC